MSLTGSINEMATTSVKKLKTDVMMITSAIIFPFHKPAYWGIKVISTLRSACNRVRRLSQKLNNSADYLALQLDYENKQRELKTQSLETSVAASTKS